jgi:hypothetical protein
VYEACAVLLILNYSVTSRPLNESLFKKYHRLTAEEGGVQKKRYAVTEKKNHRPENEK